jgi:hypothetical protein
MHVVSAFTSGRIYRDGGVVCTTLDYLGKTTRLRATLTYRWLATIVVRRSGREKARQSTTHMLAGTGAIGWERHRRDQHGLCLDVTRRVTATGCEYVDTRSE